MDSAAAGKDDKDILIEYYEVNSDNKNISKYCNHNCITSYIRYNKTKIFSDC
jgi:hypothetical protein